MATKKNKYLVHFAIPSMEAIGATPVELLIKSEDSASDIANALGNAALQEVRKRGQLIMPNDFALQSIFLLDSEVVEEPKTPVMRVIH